MPKKIRVCQGPHCRFRGSARIMAVLAGHFGLKAGEANEHVDLNFCPCTDNCDWGPNVVEDDTLIYSEARPRYIAERLEKRAGAPLPAINLADLKLDELL